MTLAQAKAKLRQIGVVLKKVDDEYIVNFKGGREATAYYTSDLDDAVSTGEAMVAKGLGAHKEEAMGFKVPSVEEVVKELKAIQKEMVAEEDDGEGLEVRLQVTKGTWVVHYGDPGFDTDHHGYWGDSSISYDASLEDLKYVAESLIEDVEDEIEMGRQDIEDGGIDPDEDDE